MATLLVLAGAVNSCDAWQRGSNSSTKCLAGCCCSAAMDVPIAGTAFVVCRGPVEVNP